MGTSTVLVWALWLQSGGSVNSGYLKQPAIAAYFETQAECRRVANLVYEQARWTRCIQAAYIIPGGATK